MQSHIKRPRASQEYTEHTTTQNRNSVCAGTYKRMRVQVADLFYVLDLALFLIFSCGLRIRLASARKRLSINNEMAGSSNAGLVMNWFHDKVLQAKIQRTDYEEQAINKPLYNKKPHVAEVSVLWHGLAAM